MLLNVAHFQAAERVNPVGAGGQLPETVYAIALDYLVIACVDLVFTHQQQVLLAKRNRLPRPSWWVVGGRMVAGEDPRQTAQHKAAQEAGLENLERARFQPIGVYSTCFAVRQQLPQEHGAHTLNLAFAIELTVAEKTQLRLHASEYDTWCWVQPEQVPDLLDCGDTWDAALLKLLADWQAIQG